MTTAIKKASTVRYNLEKLGKKLATFTKDTPLTKKTLVNIESIDISAIKADIKANKSAFHNQLPTMSKKLLGKTPIGRYSRLASTVIPESTFEKVTNSVTDTVFMRIGKLAQRWANSDLQRDTRFAERNLDQSERHALAKAIAEQNRALATAGSVSNLAGLAGIVVDTAWLLTISLRNIFQVAQIYDKPLTGMQGIVIAYEILAKTDLNKLQEKQTLLTALGVFEAVADDGFGAYRLENKTDNDDTDYSQVQGIFGKVEELATQFNINLAGFNFGFLHKVLPISAVGIGATYNNIIINEVIQVTEASFAPSPKLAQAIDR